MPDLFESLIEERSLLMVDQKDGISSADLDRLHAYVPRFRQRCGQLQEYGISATLVNTDLCFVNIGFTRKGPVFFDWAESVVTSPLCSMRMFMLDVADAFPGDDRASTVLRDAYLSAAVPDQPPTRVAEAFRLIEPVSLVGRALTWRDCLREVPQHRRLEGSAAVPRNMRALLALTGDG